MRNAFSLICNLAIFVITLCVSVFSLSHTGLPFLKWFTTLSNMLCALGCALALPFNVRALRRGTGRPEFPHWLEIVKFAGTIAVTVTFVTVFTFLNFLVGLPRLLSDTQYLFHLVNPLLALLTCCAFERLGTGIARKEWLWGVLPLALYSVVYAILVLVIGPDNGGWNDFYGFNIIPGMWPVSFACMWVAATLLSFVVWKISGGKARKRR